MELPREFEERMKIQLGADYGAFRACLDRPPYKGLLVNTLKVTAEDFLKLSPWELERVPWSDCGFYYGTACRNADRPGLSPLHDAGLYYIQEPSAMCVGTLAGEVLSGEGTRDAGYGSHAGGGLFSREGVRGFRILDLCAAPGGKSARLAALMEGRGLLVANEIHSGRAKILSSNIERLGVRNAVVTNENPKRIAGRFSGFFDLAVVDAPCSGEGMFRKDPVALEQWSPELVRMCADRQAGILDEAARTVRPGGYIIYSTCTFSPDEDEGCVEAFLKTHADFELCRTERIWPHIDAGEGHFAAVLKKSGYREKGDGCSAEDLRHKKKNTPQKGDLKEALRLFEKFESESLTNAGLLSEGFPILFGDNLCLMPDDLDLSGLKVLRAGLHLGTIKKGRFEPAHALSHVLGADDVRHMADYPPDGGEIMRYLRGEGLPYDESAGWTLVGTHGFGIGWGKASGGALKNHYPKGLRRVGG